MTYGNAQPDLLLIKPPSQEWHKAHSCHPALRGECSETKKQVYTYNPSSQEAKAEGA